MGSVTVVTPFPAAMPAVPEMLEPLAFSCTVSAFAMQPRNMSRMQSLFQSPFSVEWMMSLMSAGGRAFTPMMLASRTGVTSGRTRLSSDVTWAEVEAEAVSHVVVAFIILLLSKKASNISNATFFMSEGQR